jgi:GAF domain-containing protein
MSYESMVDHLGSWPGDHGGHGPHPGKEDARADWLLSSWRVKHGDDAAGACAGLAVTLARLGASTEDRGQAVASLWTMLGSRMPALVSFRLTRVEDHRMAVLAVDDQIAATIRLPRMAAAAGLAEPVPALLDIIADQEAALEAHRRELESTDRGLLALHAELADKAEQLSRSAERQHELLRTEQAARAAAEAARSRLAFLSHVGAVLGASLDHRQVLSRLATLLVPRYAAGAQIWLPGEQGELELYGAAGQAGPPDIVRRVRVTRRPEQQVTASGPGQPDQGSGLLAVPLVSLGTVLGVLAVTPPGRPFAHDDVIIVSEVAGRAAAALVNALRFEQEREVAQRLQHAMLTELPTGPGVECAARYLPAVTGLNVGGDWYDAFCRPDGTLVLAVGDVVGHGLAAAALMGQLRTAMRAYAMDLPEPGEVLTKLHALIRHIDPDHCATAVLAMVTPGGQMSFATAGHPPPLLREADGTVRCLEYLDPMLGLPIDHQYATSTLTLRPGSVLLFYTDGLIERRDAIIDAGIGQLAATFGAAPGGPEQIADSVCEVMLSDSSREDDTCLLVCRLAPDRAPAGEGGEPPPSVQAEPLT